MAQITVSISDELESRLRKYCEDYGYQTVSSLVAESLREKLENNQPLDYWQRVALVVQLENNRLLESLMAGKKQIDEKDWHFSTAFDALREGYVSEYNHPFEYIYAGELSKSASDYVMDVLAMYDDLQWSAKESKDEEVIKLATFLGFDGNHETGYLGFARYLQKHQRFESVYSTFPDMNSHRMTPNYRSMLARYKEIRDGDPDLHHHLTKKEIAKIVGRDK